MTQEELDLGDVRHVKVTLSPDFMRKLEAVRDFHGHHNNTTAVRYGINCAYREMQQFLKDSGEI